MPYKTASKKMSFQTSRRLDFVTITKEVEDFIKESCVKEGIVVIQTLHTTCSIWVNEDEKNLVGNGKMDYEADLHRVLDRFAHPDEEYHHNDVMDARNKNGKRDTHLCEPDEDGVCHECLNGHSHAHAMILPHSVTLIIRDGKLQLGQWQQVMLVELDHNREREVIVLVQGITD